MWSSLQTSFYAALTHPGVWVIALFVVTATYIQFRGRVRLKLRRQIFDHSTFTSPYNSLMYAFSSAPTTPYVDVAAFPQLKMLADNWTLLRDEGLKLFDEGHIKAAEKHNDAGFRTFFQYVHVLQTYGRRVKNWHYPTYWVTKKLILVGILYLLYLALF